MNATEFVTDEVS